MIFQSDLEGPIPPDLDPTDPRALPDFVSAQSEFTVATAHLNRIPTLLYVFATPV